MEFIVSTFTLCSHAIQLADWRQQILDLTEQCGQLRQQVHHWRDLYMLDDARIEAVNKANQLAAEVASLLGERDTAVQQRVEAENQLEAVKAERKDLREELAATKRECVYWNKAYQDAYRRSVEFGMDRDRLLCLLPTKREEAPAASPTQRNAANEKEAR